MNLSLGPNVAYPYDPGDPINFPTWVMSGSQLCVFAAGNEGAGAGTVTT